MAHQDQQMRMVWIGAAAKLAAYFAVSHIPAVRPRSVTLLANSVSLGLLLRTASRVAPLLKLASVRVSPHFWLLSIDWVHVRS